MFGASASSSHAAQASRARAWASLSAMSSQGTARERARSRRFPNSSWCRRCSSLTSLTLIIGHLQLYPVESLANGRGREPLPQGLAPLVGLHHGVYLLDAVKL